MELALPLILISSAIYRFTKGTRSRQSDWLTAALALLGTAFLLSSERIGSDGIDPWLYDRLGVANLSQLACHLITLGAAYCAMRWASLVCGTLLPITEISRTQAVLTAALLPAFFLSTGRTTPALAMETLPGFWMGAYDWMYAIALSINYVTYLTIGVRTLRESPTGPLRIAAALFCLAGIFGLTYALQMILLPLLDFDSIHEPLSWLTAGLTALALTGAGISGTRMTRGGTRLTTSS